MGKIDTLQKYIDACDEKRNNPHDKYEFIQQVFGAVSYTHLTLPTIA